MDWFTHSDMLGSNHFPVCIVMREENDYVIPTCKYKIKAANWTSFANSVDLKVEDVDVNKNCESISKIIIEAADKNIPIKSPYVRG